MAGVCGRREILNRESSDLLGLSSVTVKKVVGHFFWPHQLQPIPRLAAKYFCWLSFIHKIRNFRKDLKFQASSLYPIGQLLTGESFADYLLLLFKICTHHIVTQNRIILRRVMPICNISSNKYGHAGGKQYGHLNSCACPIHGSTLYLDCSWNK